MNQLINQLQKQAITAAKQGDWQKSAEYNQQILESDSKNIKALNRLGFCYIQLEKPKLATEMYERVLELEKLNTVAKKYLQLLKKKNGITKQPHIDAFQDFVEEPGKTKIIQLDRLGSAELMDQLSVAASCILKPKGRFVSVTTKQGEYIGSLPEDISFHLSKLIKSGNQYECVIKSVSKQECSVFIKEIHRSPENALTPSFLSNGRIQTETEDDMLLSGILDDDDVIEKVDEVEESTNDADDDSDMKEQLPSDILGEVMRD